jgi:hypothetical protein
MPEILDKLRGRRAAREASLADRWNAVVQALANGKAAKPDEVESLLAEADKTIENLDADVTLLQRRRAAREAYDRGQSAIAEAAQVHEALNEAERVLNADVENARQKYSRGRAPLLQREQELIRLQREGAASERFLRESASVSPEQAAQLADLKRRLQALDGRRADAVQRARAAEESAAEKAGHLEGRFSYTTANTMLPREWQEKFEAEVRQLDAVIAAAKAEATTAAGEVPLLRQAITELENVVLEP